MGLDVGLLNNEEKGMPLGEECRLGLVVGLVNNKANSSTPPGVWSVYGG